MGILVRRLASVYPGPFAFLKANGGSYRRAVASIPPFPIHKVAERLSALEGFHLGDDERPELVRV